MDGEFSPAGSGDLKPNQWRKYLALIVFVALVLEGTTLLAGTILKRATDLYYQIPEQFIDFAEYLSVRDEYLGWPAHEDSDDGFQPRFSPAFPETEPSCISLYGDSFVFGQDVDEEQAWGNQLALLLDCRVANFGVNGYGTDQAYLRYLHNARDSAEAVILGHMSENIRRNVNQYRHLLTPPSQNGLKPRFIINDQNELELIPLPQIGASDFPQLLARPEDFLSEEYFLPGGPFGHRRFTFPYSWSLLSLAFDARVQARLRGEPSYVPFYDPDHPSEALWVTLGILEQFQEHGTNEGKHPVILIIPSRYDLAQVSVDGEWIYQSLLDELEENALRYFQLGPGLLEYLGQRDPDELFAYTGLFYGSHYNGEGNRVIAQLLHEYLEEEGLADILRSVK